jgi:transglutaminase-like putative cysteine protease
MLGLPPQSTPPLPWQPRPLAFTWLLLALGLVIVPHITRVPLWITLVVGCFGAYRLLHDHRHWKLPPRWLVTLLAVSAIFGIMASYGTLVGRHTAIAFLLVLLGLKLLETRSHRDVTVLICIGYFLLTTTFLYAQSPGMVAYLMLVVWLLTVSLIHFQHLGDAHSARLRLDMRQGGLLLVQSLPLMLIFFVFFPRFDRPLWGLPEDAGAGVTGLSEEMSPGQITELSTSSAVAFRVEFDGAMPPSALQYWRGLVLWDYDGDTWRPGVTVPPQPLSLHRAGASYTYEITLEPHHKPWLFSLDLPYAMLQHGRRDVSLTHAGYYRGLGRLTSDWQLRAIRPVSTIRRYTLRSYAHYHTGGLRDDTRQRALQLPATLDARVLQLVQQWRRAGSRDHDVVRQALHYFRDQPFVYTLTPPALPDDPTASFLFETRRGYCEHFASSFTVLMRRAGIPARVVVGYQGGELNPLGSHLTVLQRNAHAWSEVWLDEHGWMRVDPTTMVAPERIERGLEAFPELSPTPMFIRHSTWLYTLWRSMRLSWDIVHHTWNRWVLQYSAERQTQLMVHLGLGKLSWQGLTVALVVFLSLTLAIVTVRMFRQQTPRDRVVLLYQRFCNKLARRGMVRHAHEGPVAFAQRVQQQRPAWADQVDLIVHLYCRLRYGRQRCDADLKRLRRAVQTFRPKR